MSATTLEILGHDECYRLLASTRLGRIATTSNALPVIFPVQYALLGADLVFRTDPGSKLRAGASGSVVCLEVDQVDAIDHLGWSVLVTGRSSVVSDPDELAVARDLPLRPWFGNGDAFVRIEAAIVSGRRLSLAG